MNLVLTFVFGPRKPVGETPLAKQRTLGQAVWVFRRQWGASQDNGTYTDATPFLPTLSLLPLQHPQGRGDPVGGLHGTSYTDAQPS